MGFLQGPDTFQDRFTSYLRMFFLQVLHMLLRFTVFFHISVRGMMYYRQALELQCFLDMGEDRGTRNLLSDVDIVLEKKLSQLVFLLATCFLLQNLLAAILGGYRNILSNINFEEQWDFSALSQAIADIKFTYVVSCQVYGAQKKSADPQERGRYLNILNLMLR